MDTQTQNILKISVIFIILDAFFLWFMRKHFQQIIRNVQGSELELRIMGAVVCYIFLIYGFYKFIAVPRKSYTEAFLLGLIIYGVFESTTYAMLKKWPLRTAIIDTLWGACLFAMTHYLQSTL